MALLDELPPGKYVGGRCKVGLLLDSLPADVRSELKELLGTSEIQSQQIAGLAQIKGWDIRVDSILRHRRGDCKCR